jgi:DNA-binding MarR family transcriptional regulator
LPTTLQQELQQAKPFNTRAEEACLAILRTSAQLDRMFLQKLRPFNLTPPQYNLLRILRGAGPKGLACGQISDRMIALDPDVTRLLDRLEKRGLITRARERDDRRVVITTITASGIDLISPLDDLTEQMVLQLFQSTSADDTRKLIDLLAHVRHTLDSAMNDSTINDTTTKPA